MSLTRAATTSIIRALRKEYQSSVLDECNVAADPMKQFGTWFHEAIRSGVVEPNAMILSTVGPHGRPSSRTVLLKEYDARGLVFFSNYESQKGREIEHQPRVSVLFLWKELERQIRIEGVAAKVSRRRSVSYFAGRPRGAQLSAFASPQSEVLDDRRALEELVRAAEQHFSGKAIPCPRNWGGYVIRPTRIEFWQGRENRLHDRIVYRQGRKGWKVVRFAP